MTVPFFNYIEFSDTTQTISYGSGSPEGSLSAPVGSLYLRNDGASGSIAYLKASGAGNTNWEAISTNGISGATILDELNDVNALTPSDGDVLTYVGGSISEWQALPASVSDLSPYLPKSAGSGEALTGPLYIDTGGDTSNVDIAFGAANTGLMKSTGLNGVDIVAGGVVGASIWDAGGGNILQTYSAFATTFNSSFLTSFTSPAAEFKGTTGGGGRCEFRFYENDGGSNYIAFLAPADVQINREWTWPQAEIAEGQVWIADSTSTAVSGILTNRLLVLDDISDFPSGTDGQVLTFVGGSFNGWVAADPTGGAGGGITSLNAQEDTSQTFATVNNGSNVTLSVGSSGGVHTFTTAWAGDLAVADGGTGQSTYTNGQLLIGNTTGNTLSKSTLTASTGIDVTNGGGSITLSVSGLTVTEFSSANISQWTNDSNYFDTAGSGLTSSTNTVNVGAGSGIAVNANDVALDINSLSVATIADGDFIPFWDITTTATNKKIAFSDFKLSLVDPITAGGLGVIDNGLQYEIVLDFLTLPVSTDLGTNDLFAIYDYYSGGSDAHRTVTLQQLADAIDAIINPPALSQTPLGNLQDVNDTTSTDPDPDGQVLSFVGGSIDAWQSMTLAEAGISEVGHTHTESDITDLQAYLLNITLESLGDLADVDATLPNEGSVLVYEGGSSDIWKSKPQYGTAFPVQPVEGESFTRTDLAETFTYYSNVDGVAAWLGEIRTVGFGRNLSTSAANTYTLQGPGNAGPLSSSVGRYLEYNFTIVAAAYNFGGLITGNVEVYRLSTKVIDKSISSSANGSTVNTFVNINSGAVLWAQIVLTTGTLTDPIIEITMRRRIDA